MGAKRRWPAVIPWIIVAIIYALFSTVLFGMFYEDWKSGVDVEATVIALFWPVIIVVGLVVLPFALMYHIGRWLAGQ